MAFACHVIGPLSPTMWKLTASLRPSSIAALVALANGSGVASLQIVSPGGMVTRGRPPKVRRWFVPATIAELPRWRPTYAPSTVIGFVPNAFDRRMRVSRPQIEGRTIRRNDWSRAPAPGVGNASDRSGCADGLPLGYGPCAEAVQATTQRSPARCAAYEMGMASDAASVARAMSMRMVGKCSATDAEGQKRRGAEAQRRRGAGAQERSFWELGVDTRPRTASRCGSYRLSILEIVMSRFPRLARVRSLWRNLVRRGRAEGALDEEVRGAVELIVERRMRGGLSREEAQRAAALEFGAVEAVKQQVRDVRSGAAVESLLQDVRYAWRALRRSPLFAVTAAASLALGVAGNALVFSLFDAWLLQNRPGLSETSRLVEVGRVDSREGPGTYGGDGFDTFSYPTYLDVRARQRVFDGLAAYQSGVTFGLGAGDSSDKVSGAYVSANYFDVLGVRIALGRGFTPDEEQMGNPRAVVVISDQVWRRQFSGAPDVVGRTLRLNGRPFTIVGVTAPEFAGASIDRTETLGSDHRLPRWRRSHPDRAPRPPVADGNWPPPPGRPDHPGAQRHGADRA